VAKFLRQIGLLRILGLLFAFILGFNLLSACNGQPVTLSFVVPQIEAEFWKPLIEQFEARNPNIRIDLANDHLNNQQALDSTDGLKGAYLTDFNSKPPSYDLVYMDIIWVPEFAEKGWLMDLTDKFEQEKLKGEFLISEVDNGVYNNKLYRIPFRTDVGVLYYRKDLLKKVNEKPPETFEDLFRISQKLKGQQVVEWGYLWPGQHSEGLVAMFVEVLEGYGGFWINQSGDVGVEQPEAIEAVKFLRRTIEQGISPQSLLTYSDSEVNKLFLDGEAVFLRHWPAFWVDANSDKSSIRGKIAIQPMVHAEGQGSGVCKGGWGFGIAKTTKHKKEALQVIKFLTSAAAQRQFTLAYGSVPSRRKLFFDPKIVARYSHYPELLNVIDKYWISRPRIPQYGPASCILQKYLSEALDPELNTYSPQEAMQNAARDTKELLRMGTYNCP